MKKIRFAALLLALLVLLQITPVRVQATDIVATADIEQRIIDAYSLENELNGSGIPGDPGTAEGSPVSMEDISLTVDTLERIFFSLRDGGKLPWYAAPLFGYNYLEGADTVTDFTPYYLDRTVYDRALYEQKVAEILAAAVHEGMDQWQMALSVHDYLATHFEYDTTLTYHRGYDLLVRGTAVCEGYAEAYMDLMNRLGIECRMVSSAEMEHGWNIINIYGNWYHVDVTWDDPKPNVAGYVSHAYFMATDEELLNDPEDPHYNWASDVECTDTGYTEAFWKDIHGAINYPDSTTSYLSEFSTDGSYQNYILSRDELSGETTVLYTEEPMYVAYNDEYTTHYDQYGLTLWNGRLYACDMDKVYSMNPDGSDLRTEFTYDAAGNGKYIYGCFVEDGIIRITLADPDGNQTEMDVALDETVLQPYHTHSYTSTPVEATCTENGYTEYVCSCGITVQENFVLATGHCYDSGTILRDATEDRTGIKEFSCLFCGDSYQEQLPMIDKGAEAGGMIIALLYVVSGPVIVILLIRRARKKRKQRKQNVQ